MPKILQVNPSVLCFSKFSVAKKFMDKMGGTIKIFRRKFSFLTVPKYFVGESFTVAVILGTGKVWIRRGVEYQAFLSKIFCLTVPK